MLFLRRQGEGRVSAELPEDTAPIGIARASIG
jgi:hypothetical protein